MHSSRTREFHKLTSMSTRNIKTLMSMTTLCTSTEDWPLEAAMRVLRKLLDIDLQI
jgi:hypothetical protein